MALQLRRKPSSSQVSKRCTRCILLFFWPLPHLLAMRRPSGFAVSGSRRRRHSKAISRTNNLDWTHRPGDRHCTPGLSRSMYNARSHAAPNRPSLRGGIPLPAARVAQKIAGAKRACDSLPCPPHPCFHVTCCRYSLQALAQTLVPSIAASRRRSSSMASNSCMPQRRRLREGRFL